MWFGLSSTQPNLSKLVKIQLARVFCSTEATKEVALPCPLLCGNYLEMSLYYQRGIYEYHKAEPKICRNLGDKKHEPFKKFHVLSPLRSPRCLPVLVPRNHRGLSWKRAWKM